MEAMVSYLEIECRAVGGSHMAFAGRGLFLRIMAAVLISLSACGDAGGPTGSDPLDAVANVTVSPAQATVEAGSTVQLSASVLNGRGVSVHVHVEWASSAPSVATVDEDTGLVTGVSEGSAAVTASAGGISGSAAITVTDPEPT